METGQLLAAAFCTLPFIGVALALGKLFSSYYSGLAQNPQAKEAMGSFIIAAAMIEAIAIFSLLVALIILFA